MARYIKVRGVAFDTNGYDMSSKAMRDAEKTAGIKKAVEVNYDHGRYMDINIEEAGAEVVLKREDKEKAQQLRQATGQSTTMANRTEKLTFTSLKLDTLINILKRREETSLS